jgi:hypothetical protein
MTHSRYILNDVAALLRREKRKRSAWSWDQSCSLLLGLGPSPRANHIRLVSR